MSCTGVFVITKTPDFKYTKLIMRRLIITLTFFFCIVPYICGSGKEREYRSESIKIDILPDWALGNFIRPKGVNPIIKSDSKLIFHCPMKNGNVKWAESNVFNPSAVVRDGKINILFCAEDNSEIGIGSQTSRIGLATFSDGIHMNICKNPVLFPGGDKFVSDETPGGCEDPRIAVTKDGLYVMMYTMWNRKNWMLNVATSRDLVHWIKHSPAFYRAYNGKYRDLGCKSGALVTKIVNGKQVIVKVNGRYLMYWGEETIHADLVG